MTFLPLKCWFFRIAIHFQCFKTCILISVNTKHFWFSVLLDHYLSISLCSNKLQSFTLLNAHENYRKNTFQMGKIGPMTPSIRISLFLSQTNSLVSYLTAKNQIAVTETKHYIPINKCIVVPKANICSATLS